MRITIAGRRFPGGAKGSAILFRYAKWPRIVLADSGDLYLGLGRRERLVIRQRCAMVSILNDPCVPVARANRGAFPRWSSAADRDSWPS